MNIIDLTSLHTDMDFQEYQELARRTANPLKDEKLELCNWGLGLAGEAGEVVELIKKNAFHGKPLSIQDLTKELGDVLWYVSNVAAAVGIDLQEVAEKNIEKLAARYPQGFKEGGGIRSDRPDTELIHDHKANLADQLDTRI